MNQEIIPATLDELFSMIDELVPASKEQLTDTQESTTQQVELVDMSFNLTKPIQDKLDLLAPTVVFTNYEPIILPDTDIKSLVPVPDHTLHQLLILLAGKGTTPYMLDGSLLAHTADGAYLKIIPTIDKDGYASYTFSAVDYRLLNNKIERYCKLLQKQLPGFKDLFDFFNNPNLTLSDLKETATSDIDEEFDPFSTTTTQKRQERAYQLKEADDDEYGDEDTSTLKDLYPMLKARTLSTWHHMECHTALERLTSTKAMYAEDSKLLVDLRYATKRVYRQRKKRYYTPAGQHFDPPYRISAHRLSAWVYFREDYTKHITNGDYHVDHIEQGIEYRSDNRPCNLCIVPADYNTGRTRRSVKTHYNGKDYVSLSACCKALGIEKDYDSLQDKVYKLQPGMSFDSDSHTYTLTELKKLVVTDCNFQSAQITYNGKIYDTLKDFATAYKLKYAVLRNLRSIAKKAGSTDFKHKNFNFLLLANGGIKITR